MTEPGIRTLIRPVITVRPDNLFAKIVTVDWDELLELADKAGGMNSSSVYGWEPAYATGVHDALRWLASGVPTPALLNVLGEK